MLKEKLKNNLITAMKLSRETEKNIIRVTLGEIATQEGRTGEECSDEKIQKIIRKIIQSNEETLKYCIKEDDNYNKLKVENKCLMDLLPKNLNKMEILLNLANVLDQIKQAKNDGQATGIAIKHLKEGNYIFLGEEVKQVVEGTRHEK